MGVKALDKVPAQGTDADQADSGDRPAIGRRVQNIHGNYL
jgi:hypothetical protein